MVKKIEMTKNKVELLEYQKIETKNDDCLQNCCLDLLEKYLEKNKLSSALKVTATGIKATSYVGVIKFRNIQIEILPKLISENSESEVILNNLLYMLSYTKKLDIKTSDSAKLSKTDNPFLEVLIREFANSLFNCLKRLTPKNYIRKEDNLNFLKGKILFTENIKYNCVNKAKFYCEFDEFSEDCILNHLFYYVAMCLYTISKNSKNKQLLKMITDYFCDIKLIKFDSYKCEKIKLTRQQKLFEKPFKLAKMFVEHSSVDLSKNKFENITLLWDINKLFEEFIYQVIRHKIPEAEASAQTGRKLLDEKNRLTKADIIIKRGKSKIIIDTKYKKLESFDSVSSGDLYQVGMYCHLHDENNNTEAVLLYPKYPKTEYLGEKEPLHYNSHEKKQNYKYKVSIKTINLMIDNIKKDLKDGKKIETDLREILHLPLSEFDTAG